MTAMFRIVKFICLPALLLAGHADAHGGFENETEVRVYPDRMRVVVRTSVPFAWTILGGQAPRTADEAGQAVAKPLLAAAAPGLFNVTAGGKPMSPTKSDCIFEVHEDVAFALEFERPDEWPVTLEAKFFPLFGELDTGTIAVFDHTASRFSRDIEPLVRKTIAANDPVVSFDLTAPAIVDEPAGGPPVPAVEPSPQRRNSIVSIPLLAAVVTGWLIFAARRRSKRAS